MKKRVLMIVLIVMIMLCMPGYYGHHHNTKSKQEYLFSHPKMPVETDEFEISFPVKWLLIIIAPKKQGSQHAVNYPFTASMDTTYEASLVVSG